MVTSSKEKCLGDKRAPGQMGKALRTQGALLFGCLFLESPLNIQELFLIICLLKEKHKQIQAI